MLITAYPVKLPQFQMLLLLQPVTELYIQVLRCHATLTPDRALQLATLHPLVLLLPQEVSAAVQAAQ